MNIYSCPKYMQANWLARHLNEFIKDAQRMGFVITVEQRPLKPLAMGHYETEIEIREVREKS